MLVRSLTWGLCGVRSWSVRVGNLGGRLVLFRNMKSSCSVERMIQIRLLLMRQSILLSVFLI
jgi:hypothetical protein